MAHGTNTQSESEEKQFKIIIITKKKKAATCNKLQTFILIY